MSRRDPPLAHSTRRDVHTTLKMVLKQAVRWDLIPQNPAEFVDPPKPRETDEDDEGGEVRALTEEQVLALFRRSSPINTQGRRP